MAGRKFSNSNFVVVTAAKACLILMSKLPDKMVFRLLYTIRDAGQKALEYSEKNSPGRFASTSRALPHLVL